MKIIFNLAETMHVYVRQIMNVSFLNCAKQHTCTFNIRYIDDIFGRWSETETDL